MAHKSNGYIYTDDAVPSLIRNGVITFYNRLERYQEQAATLVMHGGKKHERVYTESEVMAIVERIGRANVLPEALYSWSVHVAKEAGVSFDPA